MEFLEIELKKEGERRGSMRTGQDIDRDHKKFYQKVCIT